MGKWSRKLWVLWCVGLAREWAGKDKVEETIRGWGCAFRREKPVGLGTGPSD